MSVSRMRGRLPGCSSHGLSTKLGCFQKDRFFPKPSHTKSSPNLSFNWVRSEIKKRNVRIILSAQIKYCTAAPRGQRKMPVPSWFLRGHPRSPGQATPQSRAVYCHHRVKKPGEQPHPNSLHQPRSVQAPFAVRVPTHPQKGLV